MHDHKPDSLSWQLFAITLARLCFNVVWRMVYPFAPALARGMGVELTAVYQLISIRNFTAFFSPIFGPWSERYGRKPILLATMTLFIITSTALFLWPGYTLLGIVLATIAISKFVFDPAMQAYLGDAVPYHQRGKAIALTETAWSLALLAGAPLVGFILSRSAWQTPFFWLALLGLVALVLLWRTIPPSRITYTNSLSLIQLKTTLTQNPVVLAAVSHVLLVMLANEIFFITYGEWMETTFNLALAGLGLASGLVGGAEISGELLAGWSVDRFGKQRVIIITGTVTAVFYTLIPFLAHSLTTAITLLALLFIFFEITVVGGIPLLTEIMPSARGIVMSLILGAAALGRTIGSLIGPRLAQWGGFTTNGLAATIIMLLAVIILIYGIPKEK
ncbi:MAG: MFS transporter [Candidatus Promineifilaceae bacterium]